MQLPRVKLTFALFLCYLAPSWSCLRTVYDLVVAPCTFMIHGTLLRQLVFLRQVLTLILPSRVQLQVHAFFTPRKFGVFVPAFLSPILILVWRCLVTSSWLSLDWVVNPCCFKHLLKLKFLLRNRKDYNWGHIARVKGWCYWLLVYLARLMC